MKSTTTTGTASKNVLLETLQVVIKELFDLDCRDEPLKLPIHYLVEMCNNCQTQELRNLLTEMGYVLQKVDRIIYLVMDKKGKLQRYETCIEPYYQFNKEDLNP